jgi:ATP-dependent RNA helicase DOB1
MTSNLFSFLDDSIAEDDLDGSEHDVKNMDGEERPIYPSKKRKVGVENLKSPRHTGDGDGQSEDVQDEQGPSSPKRPRVASPKPVVVDEFETEGKREVVASAGLTDGVEPGSRLELRHQVGFSP